MLGKRLITALWGIPLVIAAVWFSGPEYDFPGFTVLAAVAGVLGVLEFYRMVGIFRVLPLVITGVISTVFFIIYPHLSLDFDISLISLVLIVLVAFSLILMVFLPKRERPLRLWAWTLTGILYTGWLISYLVALRLEGGRNWVFLVLFATFGSDTAAYFIGKAIGRHKMAPSISPGKTWEGAAAGLLGAVIVGYLFTLSTPLQLPVNIAHAVILG